MANYAPYKIRNLPARFLIKNEYITALILTEYIRHVDPTRFYNALRVVNQRLAQASGSGVAVLFEEMCKAGLPVGTTLESVSVSGTQTGPKGYLLPLAYADYFTAYRSGDNKATYASLLEDMMPSGWIDLYWENKDAVRKAVTLASGRTPQFADLTDIAIALGLTQSAPD